jgi:hypothetical protein
MDIHACFHRRMTMVVESSETQSAQRAARTAVWKKAVASDEWLVARNKKQEARSEKREDAVLACGSAVAAGFFVNDGEFAGENGIVGELDG